jgi:formate hydrogenlyase subunit 6/NADH:ubiquinone oxidoreductase subunit I
MFDKFIFLNKALNNISKEINISSSSCIKFLSKYDVCNKCLNICPQHAIEIEKNKEAININYELCSHCGLCVSICPLNVFDFKYANFRDLLEAINKTINSNNNLFFICERFPERNKLPSSLISIPCIGMLDYSLIAHVLLMKPTSITVYADCKDCVNRKAFDTFNKLLKEVADFLLLFSNPTEICFRNTIKNSDFLKFNKINENTQSYSRRELFSYYKSNFISSTKKSISLIKDNNSKINKRISSRKNISTLKRSLFIQDLVKIDITDDNRFLNKNFSFLKTLNIDVQKCNLCSICYVLCPAKALSEISEIDTEGIKRKKGINIDYKKCINCDFCINICPKKAITYRQALDLRSYINN